jgi:hypothetical protein
MRSQKKESPRIKANNRSFLLRVVVDVAIGLHLIAALAYWWQSPHGFPIDCSRFWLNSVLPVALAAIAIGGLVAMSSRRWSIAAAAVLCFATAWTAGAIGGRVLFPVSLRGIWILALFVAAAGYICFWALIRGEARSNRLWLWSAVAIALPLGVFAIWAQQAPTASTEPINTQQPESTAQDRQPVSEPLIRLSNEFAFAVANAQLTMETQRIRIGCVPLLEFDRVSPDRFWSIFAPPKKSLPPPTVLETREANQTIRYSDDSAITFAPTAEDGALRLTSFTPLPNDTYSHVNTYCYFEISEHESLSLSFSPCPDDEIDVLPADYPTGRPSRFAYLDSSNAFRVVEATSGEKGPYRPLASGKLKRGEPLTIIFRDHGQPVAWITLEDWSKQVSTELSPTAGWNVPMNAIEFRRFYDNPAAPAAIWVTLAATAVGRGYETVGHRAGTYRNTIVFRTIAPQNERETALVPR